MACKVLEYSGQWVEVSWKGVPSPGPLDIVALVVPADADLTSTSITKYKWARESDVFSRGAGTLRFRLLNMRADMRFVFLRNGTDFPVLAAKGEPIKVANPNEPTQGHLALTSNPSEMVVQWTSKDSQAPLVRWGSSPGKYDHLKKATSLTYTRDEMCGPPASTVGWVEPGLLHRATMTALKPAARYYYIYGDEDHGFSQEASFTSSPNVGPHTTVKFLAIADMGQAEADGSNELSEMLPSLNTTRGMLNETDYHQLVVHNGDISYARGYVAQWDAFFDQIQPLATRMPYMTVIGNHERDWPGSGDRYPTQMDSGGECGTPYERRLAMPRPAEDKPWYSFDFGPIHFTQYSTEHNFSKGSEQHDFVASDLRAADRRKTPWLVVGGHRPFYIDSVNDVPPDGDQPVAQALREAFEELFVQFSVDMTWHGHHHSYQRSCALQESKCQSAYADGSQAAPVHLVIGHAGAGLCFNVEPQKPAIWEVVDVSHGYMRVEANGMRIKCEVISDADGHVMDVFELIKPADWVPRDPADYASWRPASQAGAQPVDVWLK
ncbi:hypothetical protein WJX72_010191 [[Myrmecia] bisecta]|uniref:Purple acid phosphatase n=1 Tax=[Myrmecia] bisecta TaxID=41462 RepID=A0AAW1R9I2_9CHLO